jgi:plastocyanin
MAEFKLNRLRFNWSGPWQAAKAYNRDAIVRYRGSAYVCLVPHTSNANFNVDLNAVIPVWETVLQGVAFLGDWTTTTIYSIGDVVVNGGAVYRCITGHTSSVFATDAANWETFSQTDKWRASWTVSTAYSLGDIVKYGGIVYRCITNHTSAINTILGLEDDLSKWSVFDQGIDYKGTWGQNTRYKVQDIVKVGADLWKCKTAHTSTSIFNAAYFDLWLEGEEYAGDWDSNVFYDEGDVVRFGGYDYVSTFANNRGYNPATSAPAWEPVTPGYDFEGDWQPNTTYRFNSVVRQGGNLYVAKITNNNTEPQVGVERFQYYASGSTGTTLHLTAGYIANLRVGMTVTGIGFSSGQRVIANNGDNGTYYEVILDRAPDSTPSGQLSFIGISPAWNWVSTGDDWKGFWSITANYNVGDLVIWQNATFRCINPHSSTALTRPDLDTTNSYWIIFLLHARSNAGNTIGDLITYDSAQRKTVAKPIGTEEFLLTSKNANPNWKKIFALPMIYYVGTNGVDDSHHGDTLDRPWKTVNYACAQIKAGILNPNAKTLLTQNKAWLIEEMYQWMIYQKNNNLSPFTTGSVFDETKTRRDAGFVIDALIYDISRGGNSQTVAATLAYFNIEAGGTSFVNSTVTAEMPYFIAALNQLFTLVGYTLSNTSPVISYQSANGISLNLQTSQYLNYAYVSESGTYTPANLSTNNITNNSAINYTINGKQNPTLNLVRGNTYTFTSSVSGSHPLWIQTQNGGYNASYTYNRGITGNGANNGSTLTFTVPYDAPDALYYQCQYHPGMNGKIKIYNSFDTIVDLPSAQTSVTALTSILSTALSAVSTASVPPPSQGLEATVFVKTGVYNEVLPIVVPANTAVVGDELRGTVIQPATAVTIKALAAESTTATITVNNSTQLVVGMPIQFTASFSTVTLGTTYYVRSKPTITSITISSSSSLTSVYNLTTATNLSITAYAGDALKDMFRLQNGTGLRNMTLKGLLGTLTEPNEFLTQRPTGGSFASLDPGTGPGDSSAWIIRRSPYVQNVTTFGQGCTGMKVDGNLHNGGNKSIVANDFTQILSDGIGAWITGADSKAELVSVFSYYNYAGYLAENGGRIRATNGNSSYGTFGVIAEGYDTSETPISGIVYNKSTQVQATVQSAYGLNAQLLKLSYSNAGSNYTRPTTNLLKYSNSPSNGVWSNDATIVLQQNIAAPIGYDNGWTLTASSATGDTGYIQQNTAIPAAGGSFTGLSGTTNGGGSLATFDVVVGSAGYSVTINNPGTGFVIGNTILILGTQLNGQTPANDLTITVANVAGSAISQITTSGTIPAGSDRYYILSAYVKKGTSSTCDLYAFFTGSSTRGTALTYNFDTNTVTVASSDGAGMLPPAGTYGAIPQLSTGWYRIWMAVNDNLGLNTSIQWRFYPAGRSARTAGLYTLFYGAQVQSETTATALSYYLEQQNTRYTAYANYNINSSGTGAVVVGDEIRSRSVFQTRIITVGTNVGGGGYLTASNSAQTGTSTYVTLAQSDNNTADNYINMRVFINSGTGAGQYGFITAFNTVTKIAQVCKESFDPITVTSTTTGSNLFGLGGSFDTTVLYPNMPVQFIPTYYPLTVTSSSNGTVSVTGTVGGLFNYVTVSSTANLRVGTTVTFTGNLPSGNLVTGYTYYITAVINSNNIQLATTAFGSTWQLTTAAGGYTLAYPNGTGYLSGTNITSNMTANMPVVFTGQAFGGVTTARTYYVNDIIDSNTFTISNSLVPITVTASNSSGNIYTTSDTSVLTSLNPIYFSGASLFGLVGISSSTKYYVSKIQSATTFTIASNLITTTATETAQTTNLVTVTSTVGFSVNSPIIFTGVSFGNIISERVYYILAINNSTTLTISTVQGGAAVNQFNATGNMSVRTATPDLTLTTVGSGSMTGTTTAIKTITTQGTGSMTATISTPLYGGSNITAGTIYYVLATPSSSTFTITATPGGSTAVNLSTGSGSMSLVAVGWDHINQGTPIASSLDSSSLYYIEPRITFSDPQFTQTATTLYTLAGGTTYNSAAYGNGTWLALPSQYAVGAVSTNGTIWSAITLPTSGNFVSCAFGNNYFVGIAGSPATCIYSNSNGATWKTATLPGASNIGWSAVEYGAGRFVAISQTPSTTGAYSDDFGKTWTSSTIIQGAWNDLAYGNGVWVAVATYSVGLPKTLMYSTTNGASWTDNSSAANTAAVNYASVTFGNGRFVAVSGSIGTQYAIWSLDGINWTASLNPVQATKISYGNGVFLAINPGQSTAYISEDGSTWKQRTVGAASYSAMTFGLDNNGVGYFGTFTGQNAGTLINAGIRTKGRPIVVSNVITAINLWEPGSGYTSTPSIAFTDPNSTAIAQTQIRVGNGVLSNPTIISRGTGYSITTTLIAITGNGYADQYQNGYTLIANNLTRIPSPGDNLLIAGDPVTYKVTSATAIYGTTSPNIEANIAVSPNIAVASSPEDSAAISIRTKYSQVRLTNHDFLSIGYGNFEETAYPNVPTLRLSAQNQTIETNYGRVFYTSTDQDGNFKVGTLFGVEQATGIITLSASQFGLSGLSSLSLGGIAVGGSSVVITQFSTDGSFVANSDSIIPTQKAIKTYLTSRLSQGGSNTATGNLIAGVITVGGADKIGDTVPVGTQGSSINVKNRMVFSGPSAGVGGSIAAVDMFYNSFNKRGDDISNDGQYWG